MKEICRVCGSLYDTSYRGWYSKHILKVCSSPCFREYVKEGQKLSLDANVVGVANAKPVSDRSFRSGYERTFVKILNDLGIQWKYEEFKFTLKDGSVYIPDFLLLWDDEPSLICEVKGEWTPEGKKKFNSFVKEYWHYPACVADKDFIAMLKRTVE